MRVYRFETRSQIHEVEENIEHQDDRSQTQKKSRPMTEEEREELQEWVRRTLGFD